MKLQIFKTDSDQAGEETEAPNPMLILAYFPDDHQPLTSAMLPLRFSALGERCTQYRTSSIYGRLRDRALPGAIVAMARSPTRGSSRPILTSWQLPDTAGGTGGLPD